MLFENLSLIKCLIRYVHLFLLMISKVEHEGLELTRGLGGRQVFCPAGKSILEREVRTARDFTELKSTNPKF